MTDGAGRFPVAAVAGGLFCLVLVFLALQVRAGRDPAIGSGPVAAQPARKVLVKRVVVRRIVELPPKPAIRAGGGAATATSAAAGATPAAAPPAAAPAAPPAAPAPVTSRAS